jgi:hypothetical protein
MRDECIAAVEDILGRSVSGREADRIEKAVKLHMRLLAQKDTAAWLQLPFDDRLAQAAQAAADDMVNELKRKQMQVNLQINAHDRIDSWLNKHLDNLPDKATAKDYVKALSDILAFNSKGNEISSVESTTNAIRNEAMGRLTDLWGSVGTKFFGLFESKAGLRDLIMELFDEHSGNPDAAAGAQAWKEVTDGLRERFNRAGGNIGKLEAWHLPQAWNAHKVGAVELDQFISDFLGALDRTKYLHEDGGRMTDDEISQEILAKVYDTIITDGGNKRGLTEPTSLGIIADRNAAHRALFFKDSDSYLEVQAKYGMASPWAAMTGHISRISRDTALLEVLGPNAEQTFKYFNDQTTTDARRIYPGQMNQAEAGKAFNQALYDYVSGSTRVVNQNVADAMQAFRNWETATKLGKVVLTALGDEAGMAATAFANGAPFWTGTLPREFVLMASSSARAAARDSGFGINTMISGLNRFGLEDFGGSAVGVAGQAADVTGKIANSVLKLSFAEKMWDLRRQALSSVLSSYLGRWTREVPLLSDLNGADRGILERKGITQEVWDTWRMAQPEDQGPLARTVLTPRSIYEIPDSQLAPLGNPATLKRKAATSLMSHILEEVGMGVMDTGARERVSLTLGTQAGSVGGELTRGVMLFKSFSASMIMKHYARADAMPTGTDKATYYATLVAIGMLAGAVAGQIRHLINGENPANMADPRFWMESMMRGGGLGFYGEFLWNEMSSHDTSLLAGVGGPLVSEAEGLWKNTGGALIKYARGDKQDLAGNAIRQVSANVPYANMWYTSAAFNRLIWGQLQELANPGYLDRMQERARRARDADWWWDPHDPLPQSPPNLSSERIFNPDKVPSIEDMATAHAAR